MLNLDCILNYISASTLNILRVKIGHFVGDHLLNDIHIKGLGMKYHVVCTRLSNGLGERRKKQIQTHVINSTHSG